jgi:mRNA interferase MazF
MRRGERWWAELDPPAGRRPVVILSRNDAYCAWPLVIIAPVTTHIRDITSEVSLGIAEGMPKECPANLDTITTVPKDCLRSCVSILNNKKLKELDEAIRFALGME